MVVHCVCVIIVTVYVSTLIWGISAQESGPYEVVLKTLKDCPDKGTGEISVTATSRIDKNGKIVHTGNLTLSKGLTDKLQAKAFAFIMENKQWKPIGLLYKLDLPRACGNLKFMAPIWFQILKSANVENPQCPIPKGTYHFEDYRVKGMVSILPTVKYGKYAAQLSFSRNNQKVGCMLYYADAIPK